jgi:hypothetical protein
MPRAGFAKKDQCSGSDEMTSDAGGAMSTPGLNREPTFSSVADLVDPNVNYLLSGSARRSTRLSSCGRLDGS